MGTVVDSEVGNRFVSSVAVVAPRPCVATASCLLFFTGCSRRQPEGFSNLLYVSAMCCWCLQCLSLSVLCCSHVNVDKALFFSKFEAE
jgi:hypothetical protein